MKKLKRLAAVLLAGIMALALFTACSDSDPGNPEFDAKVESAYQEALKTKFEKELENGEAVTNDADIKRLAIEHIEEKHGADSLTGEMLWKTDGDGKNHGAAGDALLGTEKRHRKKVMCRFSTRPPKPQPSKRTLPMFELCSAP